MKSSPATDVIIGFMVNLWSGSPCFFWCLYITCPTVLLVTPEASFIQHHPEAFTFPCQKSCQWTHLINLPSHHLNISQWDQTTVPLTQLCIYSKFTKNWELKFLLQSSALTPFQPEQFRTKVCVTTFAGFSPATENWELWWRSLPKMARRYHTHCVAPVPHTGHLPVPHTFTLGVVSQSHCRYHTQDICFTLLSVLVPHSTVPHAQDICFWLLSLSLGEDLDNTAAPIPQWT